MNEEIVLSNLTLSNQCSSTSLCAESTTGGQFLRVDALAPQLVRVRAGVRPAEMTRTWTSVE